MGNRQAAVEFLWSEEMADASVLYHGTRGFRGCPAREEGESGIHILI